jgi:hypothetical protein
VLLGPMWFPVTLSVILRAVCATISATRMNYSFLGSFSQLSSRCLSKQLC